MDNKDVLDFINANFTTHTNMNSYNKLNCFVDAMKRGLYYPLTDEEIHQGIEYKKAEGKALLKCLDPIIPNEEKPLAETIIETFCNQCLQQFLDYKHTYEKQNNHITINK